MERSEQGLQSVLMMMSHAVSLALTSMGGKLLLFFTFILQIVDRGAVNFKCMDKIHNDLKIILSCLLYDHELDI